MDRETQQFSYNIETTDGSEQNRQRAQEFLRKEVDSIMNILRTNPPTNEDEYNKLIEYATIAGQGLKVIDTILEEGDEKKSTIFFAVENNQVIGVAIAPVDKKMRLIDSFVCVQYNRLRQGIASALVQAGFSTALQKGVDEISVSVWEGSKTMLEKMGYELIPTDSDNYFRIQLKRE